MIPEEPFVAYIHELAGNGLTKTGHHGPVGAMGVPRDRAAELGRHPVRHRAARAPAPARRGAGRHRGRASARTRTSRCWLDIPLFVSDMSFGALVRRPRSRSHAGPSSRAPASARARAGCCPRNRPRTAATSTSWRRRGSAGAGTCSRRCRRSTSRAARARRPAPAATCPATRWSARSPRSAACPRAPPAISPARFPDWTSVDDFRRFADEVRERSGGIPIGFKLSAQHIEDDLDAALAIGVDYVILDGRGGGTGRGAAALPRQHLGADDPRARPRPSPSRPPRPARRHARRHRRAAPRTPTSPRRSRSAPTRSPSPTRPSRRSAASACGPATRTTARSGSRPRQPHLRARLPVEEAAQRLDRFLRATVELMQVLARACGHSHLRRVLRRRPDHVRPGDGPPDRHRLRRGDAVSEPSTAELVWHKVAERDDLPDGRVPDRRRGPALARAHPRRRRVRRARQPLPAPGRPARRGLDREGPAALPVARLRLRPAHRHAPGRLLRRSGLLPARGP